MDERLKFIARLLDGDKMAPLCREFSISRKTGYKILKRYNDCGLQGLTNRSLRPLPSQNAGYNPFSLYISFLKCGNCPIIAKLSCFNADILRTPATAFI